MSIHIQDVYDGTLDVDDESHDDGVLVRDDVPSVLDDGDALVLDHDDSAVLVLDHDDGAVLVLERDDALLVLERDDALLERDEQDVIHVLLSQVLLDDVRHHEKVLQHDCHHLC